VRHIQDPALDLELRDEHVTQQDFRFHRSPNERAMCHEIIRKKQGSQCFVPKLCTAYTRFEN
jgi:hypothetical protein